MSTGCLHGRPRLFSRAPKWQWQKECEFTLQSRMHDKAYICFHFSRLQIEKELFWLCLSVRFRDCMFFISGLQMSILSQCFIYFFKSLRGTFSWFWISLKRDHQRADWRSLSCPLQCLCLVRSVSRNATKHLTAHRPQGTICCLWAWSIRCSLFCSPCSKTGRDFSLGHFNILCLWSN